MENTFRAKEQVKAEELRIGNLVMHVGKIVEVLNVDKSEMMVYDEPIDRFWVTRIDFLSPIPLTPEILEKAGLNRKGNLAATASRKFYKIGNLIIESIPSNRVAIYFDSQTELALIAYQDYLHQLQNLHFALTGEELNIEL